MVASIKGLIMIAFSKWGVQRGKAILPEEELEGWGYPPNSKFPQDWGYRGLKKINKQPLIMSVEVPAATIIPRLFASSQV
jgi:hypothetical protein